MRDNSATTISLGDLLPDFKENSPLKCAEGESTPKEFDEIKLADADDLLLSATVERIGDRIRVNLEGQEILRRVIEESDIRSGRKRLGDEAVENSF